MILRPFIFVIGDTESLFIPPSVQDSFFVSESDEDAQSEIETLLRAAPFRPVLVLANSLALDIRREEAPALGFLDRRHLALRRLKNYYEEPSLAGLLSQDNSSFTLAGLHPSQALTFWCDFLTRHKRRFSLRLLPVEAASLAAALDSSSAQGWSLLLAPSRTGTCRQIVCASGRPVFTRLTSFPSSTSSEDQAASLMQDIASTSTYLSRLGLLSTDRLSLIALVSPRLKERLTGISSLTALTPHEAATRLHLSGMAPTEIFADRLLALFASRWRARLPVARAQERTRTRARFATSLAGATALMATLCVTLTLATASQSLLALRTANQAQVVRLSSLTAERAALRTAEASTTTPLALLRSAIARRRLFGEQQSSPLALSPLLAPLLGTARLDSFVWQNDSGLPQDTHAKLTLRLPDLPDPDSPPAKAEILAAAHALADKISDGLRPAYHVTVTRYPFPVLPEQSLSNAAPDSTTKDAPVTLDLTLEGGAP